MSRTGGIKQLLRRMQAVGTRIESSPDDVGSLLGRSSVNNCGSNLRGALSEVGPSLGGAERDQEGGPHEGLVCPAAQATAVGKRGWELVFSPPTTCHLPFLPCLLNSRQQSGLHLLREGGRPGRLKPAASFHGGLQALEICNAGPAALQVALQLAAMLRRFLLPQARRFPDLASEFSWSLRVNALSFGWRELTLDDLHFKVSLPPLTCIIRIHAFQHR